MMSACCSKHVEARNKHIEKECIKLVINQNYVEMLHGQQNVKKLNIAQADCINNTGNDKKKQLISGSKVYQYQNKTNIFHQT